MRNGSDLDYNTTNIDAYKNGEEQINDELKLLDLRIRLQLQRQRILQGEGQVNQFKGLVISEEEVETLLKDRRWGEHGDSVLHGLHDAIDRMESYLQGKIQISLDSGIFLPLEHLTWAFDLNYFARNCLLLCLAGEYDRKYEKLFGFLQDDITCKYPTIDLALQLLCKDNEERNTARLSFVMNSPLMKYLLVTDRDSAKNGLRLSHTLKLHRRIVDLFHQDVSIHPELRHFIEFYNPYDDLNPLLLHYDIQNQLRMWWEMVIDDDSARKALGILSGPSGSGKCFQIRHLCSNFHCYLFIIELSRMPVDESLLEQALHDVVRECMLFKAIPCFRGLSTVASAPDENGSMETDITRGRWNILLRTLDELPGPIFILAEKPPRLAQLERTFRVLPIELDRPNELTRKELWELFSKDYIFRNAPDWGQIASKFRFTPGQIRNALLQAHEAAYGQGGLIEPEDLHQACFSQGRHYLGQTASKVAPRYSWEDIILPPETVELLINACNQMKNRYIVYGQWGFEKRLAYGRGLSMLFSGLPGTGKTMGAQVIANELNLELYRIDLAQVVSKYIGETEKNLSRIFQEAESSNAILFFDEADALFGKRSEVKEAHDRYANIEIAYLLQKVEEYDGISILATNLAKNMDEAFLRRITFIVEFPFPDEEYRKRIWISMLPQETPVHDDVDFDFLARRFEIAGGNIKNIVLAAAFLAAQSGDVVNMQHLLRATKYEYQKIGRLLLREDLGEYYGEV